MAAERNFSPVMGDRDPPRPRMDPATGLRLIKRSPHQLTEAVTPAAELFVLAHLGVPRVDPSEWFLRIDGLVDRPCTLDLADLKARPKRTVEAVHNCCGSPLEPSVPTRRVANVRWGGVDLAELLAERGIDPTARFVWSYGLDHGEFSGLAIDGFVKDMPLIRLSAGDVLLAYEMNGEPLPPEHGYPLRLVVPGYYGTNSVKWLWRLHLAEHRADELFTTTLYNDAVSAEDIAAGLPSRRPVWSIAPDSVIVAPEPRAVVAGNRPVEVWGWAWSFRGVEAVEISTDAGASFERASLEPRRGWAWQRFSFAWRPRDFGAMTIAARAIEANGTAQPGDGARNAMHTVPVTVR